MLTSRTDENELLPALYYGPLDDTAWIVFLNRLHRRLRADYAGLLKGTSDGDAAAARELFTAGVHGTSVATGWQEACYHLDPAPHRSLRPNRVYGVPDFPDPLDSAHTAYARAVLLAGGFEDHRIIRIMESGGANLWLMVARRRAMFGAADSALLSALAPHLQTSLQISVLIERTRRRAAIADDAAARLGVGWVSLDGGGRPLEKGGRSLSAAFHGRLSEGVAMLAGEDRGRHALLLANQPRIEMIVEAVPAQVDGDARAIGFFRESDVSARTPIPVLKVLYDLSTKEAQLAWALCEGYSIAEAAAKIGLTSETARNYSKRVYVKTGATGQADLVRILLTGAATLA